MTDVETIVQNLQRLRDSCPDRILQTDRNRERNRRRCIHWLEEVAEWTDRLCHDRLRGPEVQKCMNISVTAFRSRTRVRKAYTKLVDILTDGYKSIKSKVPHGAMITGKLIEEDEKIGPMPPSQFVQQSVRDIKTQLRDPFARLDLKVLLEKACAVDINPITWIILYGLQNAHSHLRDDIMLIVPDSDGDKTYRKIISTHCEHSHKIWNRLETYLIKAGAHEGNHWAWLGLNMLGNCKPHRSDVFELLHSEKQKGIGEFIRHPFIGPRLDFVVVVRDALNLVIDDYYAQKGAFAPKKFGSGELEQIVREMLPLYKNKNSREIAELINEKYGSKTTANSVRHAKTRIKHKSKQQKSKK